MILTFQNIDSSIDIKLITWVSELSNYLPPANFARAIFIMDKEDASISTYFKKAPSEADLQFDTQIKRLIQDHLSDDWRLSLYTLVEKFDEIGLSDIHFVYDAQEEA